MKPAILRKVLRLLPPRAFCALAMLIGVPAATLQAQIPAPLQVVAVVEGQALTLGQGGLLPVRAPAVGEPVAQPLVLIYTGASTASISLVTVSGDATFSVAEVPLLPASLTPNQGLEFTMGFLPDSTDTVTGQLLIFYREGQGPLSTLTINLQGSVGVPVGTRFDFAYGLPVNQNLVPVSDGGTIEFIPSIPVNGTVVATFLAVNRGIAAGRVTAALISGEGFELVNLPLLPTSVSVNETLTFGIRFAPKRLGSFAGTLLVTADGQQSSFTLTANSLGFTFELIRGEEITPLSPGQLISFEDTRVGAGSRITLRVRNPFDAEGFIDSIAMSGGAFGRVDPTLSPPLLVPPQSFLDFSLVFQPQEGGQASGQIRFNTIVFLLSGVGIPAGPTLEFSFTTGSFTAPVEPGGLVLFPQTAVGNNSTVRFQIVNAGSLAAEILRVDLVGENSAFQIWDQPVLPVHLAPGTELSFTIAFEPATVGVSSLGLSINGQISFTLSASASPPPPLPEIHFEGPSGNVQPSQQPAIGLTLTEPYPIRLVGVLELAVSSQAFAGDPSIQFATGGRTVSFEIPANTNRAIFPGGRTQAHLQTGTVAMSIIITPTITTPGGFPMTPDSPPRVTLVVQPAPPVLTDVRLGSITTTGFVLQVTGYSTPRSLQSLSFEFVPAGGNRLASSQVAVNVQSAFQAWYSDVTSTAFGSLFSVQIPFTLMRTGSATPLNPSQYIRAVRVTAANELGVSNSLGADLP